VVVALLRPRQVPVPPDLLANDLLGDDARLAVRERRARDALLVLLELGRSIRGRQGALQVPLDSCGRGRATRRVSRGSLVQLQEDGERERGREGEGRTLVERNELDALHPRRLDLVDLGAALALERGVHDLVGEGALRAGVRLDAEHKLVVARVGRARQELAALGVGARDEERLEAHDVPLHARGDEAADVLRDGHEDLARLVAALLAAVELVLEVDGRDARLAERLGELHDGR